MFEEVEATEATAAASFSESQARWFLPPVKISAEEFRSLHNPWTNPKSCCQARFRKRDKI